MNLSVYFRCLDSFKYSSSVLFMKMHKWYTHDSTFHCILDLVAAVSYSWEYLSFLSSVVLGGFFFFWPFFFPTLHLFACFKMAMCITIYSFVSLCTKYSSCKCASRYRNNSKWVTIEVKYRTKVFVLQWHCIIRAVYAVPTATDCFTVY